MDVEHQISRIFADDTLDAPESSTGKCEEIERLIGSNWQAVQQMLWAILAKRQSRPADCAAAQVFWGAALDRREIAADKTIALLCRRFPVNSCSADDENLKWSIICKLKGVGYLSSYEPQRDAGVIEELRRLDALE